MDVQIDGKLTHLRPLPTDSVVEFETLQKIYKASLKFLTPLTTSDTYSTIVEEAIKLVGATYGHIVLQEEGEFRKVYSSSQLSFKSPVKKRGFVYKVFTTGKPLVAEISKTIHDHPELEKAGIKSSILIPLSNRNEAIGVLTLNSTKEHVFGIKEINILTLYGAMASLAIRKAHLYEEISKALELRDLFISMAAHELRTPLTTISGYTQLLNSKKNNLPPQEGKWIEELSWEVLRLTYLVQELLEVNKIKTGKLNYVLKECKINQIIDRALLDFRFSNPNREVVFISKVSPGDDKVIGDFDKLLQAIINLLENAAKFSPASSEIKITLSYKSPYLKITILDKGKGISREDLPKIFDGFYRGSNHNKEGMGLGLYLVKDIVDRHRGNIFVKSKVNRGTAFEIKLPKVSYE